MISLFLGLYASMPRGYDQMDAYRMSRGTPNTSRIVRTVMRDPVVETIVPRPIVTARGYEAIYRRFLMGRLIYNPDINNDNRKMEFPIRDLIDPLNGTFNLSNCGDSSRYLSISTGYRKSKKEENDHKLEVWIVPRFLVERDMNSSAAHFQSFMEHWNADMAPIGIFWTMGRYDMRDFNYLVTDSPNQLSNNNLYEKQSQSMKWRPENEGWARILKGKRRSDGLDYPSALCEVDYNRTVYCCGMTQDTYQGYQTGFLFWWSDMKYAKSGTTHHHRRSSHFHISFED